MNIIDRFSTHLREVLVRGIHLASEWQNCSVEPAHLLLALFMQKGSVANEILTRQNINIKNMEKALLSRPASSAPRVTQNHIALFSADAKIALEKALTIAQKNEHNYLGTEHLLAALLDINDPALEQIFVKNNLKKEQFKNQLKIVLANATQFPRATEMPAVLDRLQDTLSDDLFMPSPAPWETKKNKTNSPARKETALDYFAAHLTDPQIQSGLDPVIGRDKEIERLMQILCRRTKNNPVLLGDPGVGKTAIVEGLAKKIAAGEVPDILLNKKIYALDMGLLIAGTTYRGEFEGRLRQIIEETSANPDIILFIDELHNISGAGSNQGTMDAANILKPVLARGQVRCIGATTPAEFKKYIESDAALERRFQSIYVKESSAEDSIKILTGIKSNYEKYHNLKITDKAIAQAVRLADRYITNKFLPDKAIDLLDETAAAKRLKTKPDAMQFKLWQLQQNLDEIISAKEESASQDNFEEAVRMKEAEKIIQQEIAGLKNKISDKTKSPTISLTEKDITEQLAKIISTPVDELLISEKSHLADLEAKLQKQIIGQEEATREVAQIIRQAQLELSSPNRPLASFLFVGESGVGKTELAKILAAALYPNQNALIHLNMSEYNESFGVSKLLGSPAGYVGYKESNQFTDRVKINPYCVILFDEIDKAHKDVTKLLLQMLENGEISDSTGKKVSLKHAVIILTTSLGADELRKGQIGFGGAPVIARSHSDAAIPMIGSANSGIAASADANRPPRNDIKKRVTEKLKEYFSPEIINRLDQICLFRNLSAEDLTKIAALEINEFNQRLKRYRTAVQAEEKILDWFVQQLPEKNSAREVRRAIRGQVEKIMAEIIMQNKTKSRHTLILQENKLSVR